jgi:hypothetical protein
MAKSDRKKKSVKSEKPRKSADGVHAPSTGDGRAHDITARELELLGDLDRNPGIGASKGATMAGADADDIDEAMQDAENTFEGDVENDAGPRGFGVDPERRGRANK